jgi:microcystin-dependent protein
MKLPAWITLLLLSVASPCLAQTPPYFVGQILTFGTTFCPTGTLQANGQLLPISTNTALFSLLGTQYGGDGVSTFALPNIKAALTLNRAPLITCIAISGIFPPRG